MELNRRYGGRITYHFALLCTSVLIAFAVIMYVRPESMAVIVAFIILTGAMLWFRRKMLKPGHAKTASAAIIMSMGVFTSDAMTKFPGFIPSIGKLTVLVVFVLWLFLMIDYTIVLFKGQFLKSHWINPLNSLAMGTWIASSSVCAMGIFKYLRYFHWVAAVVITVNTVFWLIYAIHVIYQYKKLLEIKTSLVHGIVFLATVSTQSLVVDYSIWLLGETPVWLCRVLISIGLFYYMIFLILIVKRHLALPWHLTKDWNNTNCTLHGALSITGLAAIKSDTIPVDPILTLWWIVLFVFIIVETFEIIRAIKRWKALGFRLALGTYNVSQWTRNFTFSMFLAFTLHLPIAVHPTLQNTLFNEFTDTFGLFIVLLFIYEAVLFFKENLVYRQI